MVIDAAFSQQLVPLGRGGLAPETEFDGRITHMSFTLFVERYLVPGEKFRGCDPGVTQEVNVIEYLKSANA